ncbi:hypothetical protein BH11PAT4_BH11PAT4_8580 [soil metagenome]|jgi:hypothetical protein
MQLPESPADQPNVDGEFHHFQLVNQEGSIPLSISVLIHVNPKALGSPSVPATPISANDVIALHEALENFNGDFISAFSTH